MITPNFFTLSFDIFDATASLMKKMWATAPRITEATLTHAGTVQNYWAGIFAYTKFFMAPSVNALSAFMSTEKGKLIEHSPEENIRDYNDLLQLNIRLARKGLAGSLTAMNRFFCDKLSEAYGAWIETFCGEEGKDISAFASRQAQLLDVTTREFPMVIKEIESEYGFHFEGNQYVKAAETERFELYQVLPNGKGTLWSEHAKPILIIPPYVLGANILAFLPSEQRSYVHCFANQGIPTYIRIIKDINTVPAVQTMTGEDDALDIGHFCREIKARHDGMITLNGFCQGGYHALAAILSGELDGLVDALITCATPVDGSRSKSLKEYMMSLPPRFRDIGYSTKTLPNGNKVTDGRILAWVYKLRRMETESPIPAFHRDLGMFDGQRGPEIKINKVAAAINHWLTYDQKDLPLEITKMSFESYVTPIDEEGNLPVKLFGRTLNLKRLQENAIPWLICIADADDLVDKEASLVALNYIDAEVCVFPKGHASLATSWSDPTSECSLHLRFSTPSTIFPPLSEMFRGPVRFHLDLPELSKPKQ